MSSRKKPSRGRRTVNGPSLTPADLFAIATATDPQAVSALPIDTVTRIVANGTDRVLTQREAARQMVLLAIFAQTFAAALSAEKRVEVLEQLGDLLVDALFDDISEHAEIEA